MRPLCKLLNVYDDVIGNGSLINVWLFYELYIFQHIIFSTVFKTSLSLFQFYRGGNCEFQK